jgi:hypothetical protein
LNLLHPGPLTPNQKVCRISYNCRTPTAPSAD